MADCPIYTISSNSVGASIAEEDCLKELPVSPVWLRVEPNSFSDFGNELSKVTRNPINPSRQMRKGRTVGTEASAGYQTDVTPTSIQRLMQGFLFADARQAASTRALSLPIGSVRPVNVTAGTVVIANENATPVTFEVGALVHMSGFANAANNGLKVVTAFDPIDGVTVTPATVAETVTGSEIYSKVVETVGYQFAEGDVELVVTSGIPSLVSAAGSFLKPGIIPGAWVFIGGDATANRLGTNVGYARVASVTEDTLVLDQATFTPVTNTGAAVSLRLFVGAVVRNEKDPELIVQRSYQLERTLGINPVSGETQAEYAVGSIAGELTLNIPSEEKLTADLSFMACDIEYRSGLPGDTIKAGARVEPDNEEAFNSTSDVVRLRISVSDAGSINPIPLTGYVQEATLTVNNNISGNKAIGVFGNLDFNVGTFETSGSITAYFADVATLKAIRNDLDVEFNAITAFDNKGFVIDLPLLTVMGGSVNVEQDNSVTLPIEMSAVEGKHGFTLLYQAFSYLPDVAMPTA
jgi:hypothetical protein